MNITICGSIAFIEEMQAAKKSLADMGHGVRMPPLTITDNNEQVMPIQEYYSIRKSPAADESWIWDKKEEAMRKHFDKVAWADGILVLNYDKNDIAHYIGANTLLEMGLAFHYRKKIFLLHPIPEVSYKEEILGMHPIIIDGDLASIR